MFSGRQSSVSSQNREDLARARNGGRSSVAYGTSSTSQGSSETIQPPMPEPRYQDTAFAASMPELLPIDMSSRATSGSPSTASSSHHPAYKAQPLGTQNPMHKLDNIMFPSEDPFAYPNQPMMELGFQPPMSMGNPPQDSGPQYFMPESMDGIDGQLLGQPPPYVIQHPEGQPGFEFSANMFDPSVFGMPMGQHQQQHPQQHPYPQTPQHGLHPGQAYMQQHPHPHPHQQHPHQQQRRPRRQNRQIDQMFTEQGMQADFGSFFGSGRGVFQGM